MKKSTFLLALPLAFGMLLTGCTPATNTIETYSAPVSTETGFATSADSTDGAKDNEPSTSRTSEHTTKDTGRPRLKDALASLKVEDEQGLSTYKRTDYKHWVSKNSTECDTRFAVLQAEESTQNMKHAGCEIAEGRWNSIYDGLLITSASALDIDHMVPLFEAHRSGANKWDKATREAYANDLGYRNSLVAVSAKSNRTKGDKDPAKWMPDYSKRCDYIASWISVKTRWSLSVDPQEKEAIAKIVDSCSANLTIDADKAKITLDTAPSIDAHPASPNAPASVNTNGSSDPKFPTCTAAKKAGYGPYKKGSVEYTWYHDKDADGTVCT